MPLRVDEVVELGAVVVVGQRRVELVAAPLHLDLVAVRERGQGRLEAALADVAPRAGDVRPDLDLHALLNDGDWGLASRGQLRRPSPSVGREAFCAGPARGGNRCDGAVGAGSVVGHDVAERCARPGRRRSVGVLGEVAGDLVPRRELDERRLLRLADLLRLPAAGVEAAGRRRVDRARHVALEPDALPLGAPLRVRDRAPRTAAPSCRGASGGCRARRGRRSRRSCRGTSPRPGRRCGARRTGRGR